MTGRKKLFFSKESSVLGSAGKPSIIISVLEGIGKHSFVSFTIHGAEKITRLLILASIYIMSLPTLTSYQKVSPKFMFSFHGPKKICWRKPIQMLNKVEIVMLSSTEKQFWKVINDVAWRFLLWGFCRCSQTGRITNEKPFKLLFHLFPIWWTTWARMAAVPGASQKLTCRMWKPHSCWASNYLPCENLAKTLVEWEMTSPQLLLPFTGKIPNKRLVMGVFIALAENFTQNWLRIGCQVLEIATFSRAEPPLSFLHVCVSGNGNEAALLGFLLLSFESFLSSEAKTTRKSCEKLVSSSCCRRLTLMLPQNKKSFIIVDYLWKGFLRTKSLVRCSPRSGLGN